MNTPTPTESTRPAYIDVNDTLVDIGGITYGYDAKNTQLFISSPEGSFVVEGSKTDGELLLAKLTKEDWRGENKIPRAEWPAFIEPIIAASKFVPKKAVPQFVEVNDVTCTYTPTKYDGLRDPEDYGRQLRRELPGRVTETSVSVGRTQDGNGIIFVAGGVNLGVIDAGTVGQIATNIENSSNPRIIVNEEKHNVTFNFQYGTLTATRENWMTIYNFATSPSINPTGFSEMRDVEATILHIMNSVRDGLR
jgi:hypothetical protein